MLSLKSQSLKRLPSSSPCAKSKRSRLSTPPPPSQLNVKGIFSPEEFDTPIQTRDITLSSPVSSPVTTSVSSPVTTSVSSPNLYLPFVFPLVSDSLLSPLSSSVSLKSIEPTKPTEPTEQTKPTESATIIATPDQYFDRIRHALLPTNFAPQIPLSYEHIHQRLLLKLVDNTQYHLSNSCPEPITLQELPSYVNHVLVQISDYILRSGYDDSLDLAVLRYMSSSPYLLTNSFLIDQFRKFKYTK